MMESVAIGDAETSKFRSLSNYYLKSGPPPGIFLGSGLACLNDGKGIEKNSVVQEEHLSNMLIALLDPICGKPIRRVPNLSEKLPPVAGFDLTFSPLKSVSIAWGSMCLETFH